jgi:hypothetical protein
MVDNRLLFKRNSDNFSIFSPPLKIPSTSPNSHWKNIPSSSPTKRHSTRSISPSHSPCIWQVSLTKKISNKLKTSLSHWESTFKFRYPTCRDATDKQGRFHRLLWRSSPHRENRHRHPR